MISIKPFLLGTLMCLGCVAMAQEGLYDLRYNPTLHAKFKEKQEASTTASRNIERRPFIYLIDTMQLPVVDDFSTNRIKSYDAQEDDPNVFIHVNFAFTVNDEHPETLEFMFEPTYSLVKQGTTTTEVANPPLYIVYYDDGDPIAYDTGWTNIIKETDLNQGIITYDTLEPETTLTNIYDTLYHVIDDNSLWVTPADEDGRGGAHVNNSFGVDPLTQGVATFDGTDAFGIPYDITSPTAHGSADTLESKPLLLDENMENIFLSFFFQEGGRGNAPDEEDSLVLEFFNVTEETWHHAWSSPGELSQEDTAWSDQVWIRISKPEYRQPGFKFRFRNYATLSGMLDHWHIDYVRLGADRDSIREDSITDVSYITEVSTFTEPYTSVPYQHYLAAPDALQSDEIETYIRNLGYEDVFLGGLNYRVTDPEGNVILSEITVAPKLPKRTLAPWRPSLPATQIFPDLGEEFVTFNIRSSYTVSGNNDLFVNDTVHSQQVFWNHYSYDDGSAEKAYALTGAGLQLAYEFTTPVADSLRAILINFPMAVEANAEDLDIELRVWGEDRDDPIYVSEFLTNPFYTNSGEFFRYDLPEPILVDGTFHIGFRQIEANKIYIGFDVNNNSSDKLSYKINEKWFTSAIPGSLLMRPDFGEAQEVVSVEPQPEVETAEFSIYPNPARSEIFIQCGLNPVDLQLFSLDGALVFQTSAYHQDRIDLQHLNAGIYLVRMADSTTGQSSVSKLIIAR